MARELRIYPGIGIARLGDHPSSYFLSPEVPGLGPLEITNDDSLRTVENFRADGSVRRQGARFRVFEVETSATGEVLQHKEIVADGTTIEWKVELANQKAAAGKFKSEATPEDKTNPRNPGVSDDDLVIKPTFQTISGKNKAVTASKPGRFKGTEVYLGELLTDSKGRLVVLGARGFSQSVPLGQPVGADFANNEFWHDDISDGPISATVTFPGQPPVEAKGAWVIVAPPDFAPKTMAVTTLYDIARDAAIKNGWLKAPSETSYKAEVLPMLRAIADYRWTSRLPFFEQFPTNWEALGLKANSALRADARAKLDTAASTHIENLYFTDTQNQFLDSWESGKFIEDFHDAETAPSITPMGLDRASLSQAVGGGFYPGIEAGIIMTYRELYSAPFRIRRDVFEHQGRQLTPSPGFITRNMACPWQADFAKCGDQTANVSVWWPAQRPIDVRKSQNPAAKLEWLRGINSHLDLVNHVMELGFVSQTTPGVDGVYETERTLGEA
jgi:L-Lysine epsilon oxidase N-terminal/L-lysine epsilon oxidase C-terminal domain